MNNSKKELFEILNTIEGTGQFVVSGVKKSILPGMEIEGVGEIGFPISPIIVKALIKQAKRAPYGKGSETVLNSDVRSTWEIDASQISFLNAEWKKFITSILTKVKIGLGVSGRKVKANLYKMLIYEEGDFFVNHLDSEKEKGMFGTLIVCLPSKHSGGKLIVGFGGEKEEIDFSAAASNHKIPFASFFTDCEHEVLPVTSGYRICLAYNLVQESKGAKIFSREYISQEELLAAYLKKLADKFDYEPIAVLLSHQYTPANFSPEALKSNDVPRAQVLLKAAGKAGYFAKLGLVTNHKSGELEGDYYDDYLWDYNAGKSDGTMGEIYEEEIIIDHWIDDSMPDLGNFALAEESILSDYNIGEGNPIEQEQEGYTGNAGMTIDYWYHYGAIILWPKRKHAKILGSTNLSIQLRWVDFYLENWDDAELASPDFVKNIITELCKNDFDGKRYSKDPDFSPVTNGLAKLKDEVFLIKSKPLLVDVFRFVDSKSWADLMETYTPSIFSDVYQQVGLSKDLKKVCHLLNVLTHLDTLENDKIKKFVRANIKEIPAYLKETSLTSKLSYYGYKEQTKPKDIIPMLDNIFLLSQHENDNKSWVDATVKSITKKMPRFFVNDILCAALLKLKPPGLALAEAMSIVCIDDLTKRTITEPTPPKTWKRAVPKSTGYDSDVWEMLTPFLESPDRKVYDYAANQNYCDRVTSAINRVTIDLKFKTIQVGRPYTLRIIKTQRAYKRRLRHWKEDFGVLRKVLEWELSF